MKYLLLCYDDPEATAAMPAAERRAIVDDHIAFSRMLAERGALVRGDPLDAPETARTLHMGSGSEPMVTDGPFLEAKEALGGFYIIECASTDEALEIARFVPRSPGLVVEVRPLVDV